MNFPLRFMAANLVETGGAATSVRCPGRRRHCHFRPTIDVTPWLSIAFTFTTMSVLTWFFFESVPALAAVLGVALFVLLVYWRRSGRARPLLVGLAVAAALLLIQRLVVTQREQAGRILKAIETDIVASRTAAMAAALAPDFDADGLDRDAFLVLVRRQLEHVKVRWVDRWRLEVRESAAERFVVEAVYTADITAEVYSGTASGSWSITFIRSPAGWKIACVRPLRVEDMSNPTWQDVDRQRAPRRNRR